MAEKYSTYVSPYGKRDGLRERIRGWTDRLGSDKSLPWAGLGLIYDLQLVAEVLPDSLPPGVEFNSEEEDDPRQTKLEFDL